MEPGCPLVVSLGEAGVNSKGFLNYGGIDVGNSKFKHDCVRGKVKTPQVLQGFLLRAR